MSLLQMSVSGAVLIAVIAVVRAAAIHRLPKRVFVMLWGIVLLRLLAPFSIPARTSVYSYVPTEFSVGGAAITGDPGGLLKEGTVGEGGALRASGAGTGEPEARGPLAYPVRDIVWLAGVLAFAAIFFVCYVRCRREFGMSLPVRNAFAARWREEHRRLRPIELRESDRIAAPLTYGVFRPVILLPERMDWDDEREASCVLLHEYIHICRFDALLKLLAAAALCIHWFNPMVWVMYALLNKDIELACDECVVQRLGGDARAAYARALIAMEEKKSGLMPLYNNFSRNALEERIREIMRAKKITAGLVIASVALVALVAGVFATSAKAENGEETAPQTPADAAGQDAPEDDGAADLPGDGSRPEADEAADLPGDGSGKQDDGAEDAVGDGSGEKSGMPADAHDGDGQKSDAADSSGDGDAIFASDKLSVYFIKSFDGKTVAFDEAEWVQVQSARSDALGITEDDAPSGFSIYNEETRIEKLPVAEDCSYTILDWEAGYVPKELTAEEFQQVLAERMEFLNPGDPADEAWQRMPWLFTVEEGEIVSVQEKYVP